jgi:transcriptional regulator with XRE-family HTH domain
MPSAASPPTDNQLGDFLRAQRARVTPQEVGLALVSGRRVPGLRREEVAVLAGVSADYYARLEQGRERTPSAPLIDAICRALRLTPDERDHVFRLAKLAPRFTRDSEVLSPELLQTMNAFPQAIAIVTNPAFRILAANPAGSAFVAPLLRRYPNVFLALFLDPVARDFYVNWDERAKSSVSALRLTAGFVPPHPEVADLVAHLYRDSAEFRALWEDHSVAGLPSMEQVVVHPEVGLMHLSYQTFDVGGAPGLQLTVESAASGSRTAEAVALLGSIEMTRRQEHV